MTVGEHLRELRRRLVVVAVALAVAATAAFVAYPSILRLLEAPYCHVTRHCQLYVTGPLDGLSLRIKIATYGGAFLAAPVVLWELWRFVTPGLRDREKRYVIPFVAVSLLLFFSGVVLAYETFPHALRFLGAIGGPTLHQLYGPNQYLGLIMALMAVFGVTFEFPVVLVGLELVGVLSPAALARQRRWAIVGIVVVAAVITPSGDPFSMLALAVPLYVFYELAIIVGRVAGRRTRSGTAAASL
ncbi:MAG: twin-arginine translocase subunit TatC [Acidimicrobiales bacterium]|jgi:sec-independent protein translocase protein TatC